MEDCINTNLFDEVYNIVTFIIKMDYYDKFKESKSCLKLVQYMSILDRTCTENDFSFFRILGRGGFGVVYGCKRKDTGKIYAVKVMNKRRIKHKHAEKICLNERITLGMINSRFVLSLKYAFVSKEDLFLVLVGTTLLFSLISLSFISKLFFLMRII